MSDLRLCEPVPIDREAKRAHDARHEAVVSTLKTALACVEKGEWDGVLVMGMTPTGDYSWGCAIPNHSNLEVLGLIEAVKDKFLCVLDEGSDEDGDAS